MRRWAPVAGLLLLLLLQLALAERRNSVTWDEGHHLFDGYNIWKHRDYGLNPEVPPLVKMLAAAPLLHMDLNVAPLKNRFFKTEAFLGGRDFLFGNNADRILFRAHMAMALLTLLLGLLIFVVARRMFSAAAALLALALFVFDPNFLAHGVLITTDVGLSLCLLATIYAFYRWTTAPAVWRLALVGLAMGCAAAAKFTGLLVLPMLVLLALVEVGLAPAGTRLRKAAHLAGSLAVICAIAYATLWGFYGFRYQARPQGLELHPPLREYLTQAPSKRQADFLALEARVHVLPEAYLYGLADTKITEAAYTSYFWSRVHRHGTWLYFPAAFAIKSTVPLLLLVVAAAIAIAAGRLGRRREVFYLVVPVAVYLAVAMASQMNIGHRHLLPVYPFLYVLGAGAVWALLMPWPRMRVVLAPLLVVWQAAASLLVYPAYMAYANELWGGPANTYKYLSDANDDWGQQLKDVKRYLDSRGIKQCWFVYFPAGVVDPADYGIPCTLLPTSNTLYWIGIPHNTPPAIDGTVLISDSDLQGIEFGEGALNPYEQFRHVKPTAVIQHGVWVYDGHFEIPLAAALVHAQKASALLEGHRVADADAEARQAIALAPDSVPVQVAMGDVLQQQGKTAEARACYQRARTLAKTVEPELQADSIPAIEAKLK